MRHTTPLLLLTTLLTLVACAHEPHHVTLNEADPARAKASNASGGEGANEETDEEKARKKAIEKAIEKEIAANAGLLGLIEDQDGIANLFGSTEGFDSESIGGLGGLEGSSGLGVGAGGLGTSGMGLGGGGGGTGEGIGGLGTGGGGSFGSGSAQTPVGLKSRVHHQAGPGKLEHDIIERVIRRHHGALRYCFERVRAKDNTLTRGAATFGATITTEGTVTAIKNVSSSMPDEINRCIDSRIKRMAFPAPQGGEVEFSVVFDFNVP